VSSELPYLPADGHKPSLQVYLATFSYQALLK